MFKKGSKILLWAMIIPFMTGILLSSGCKDDEEECPTVNYTEIDAKIAEAQTIHNNAVEGTLIGEYEVGSKAVFQTAINNASAVRDTECVTQGALDAAVVNLDQALLDFEAKIVTAIAPENLVANWLMNGNALDNTGNGHDGTLTVGYVSWGSGTVTPTADRFGNADFAYQFGDGGNIEVPTSTAFNPPEMSIVTWIKLDDTWAHSYFFSLDIWNCYKFQVQDANKPFFTCKILKDDGSGENAWIDKDSNTEMLENGVWTHIAVTFRSGEMTFYFNGAEAMFWDDFPTGTPVEPNPAVNLCIGQALPTGVYTDIPDDPYEWKEWLGFLKGSLDDLKFYNIALSGSQVNSIYQWEKDNANE